MGPCHTWRCVSTRPGITSRPAASITSASAVAGVRSVPTAVMTPSVTRTSPAGRSPRSGSTVTTWPPLTSSSLGIDFSISAFAPEVEAAVPAGGVSGCPSTMRPARPRRPIPAWLPVIPPGHDPWPRGRPILVRFRLAGDGQVVRRDRGEVADERAAPGGVPGQAHPVGGDVADVAVGDAGAGVEDRGGQRRHDDAVTGSHVLEFLLDCAEDGRA